MLHQQGVLHTTAHVMAGTMPKHGDVCFVGCLLAQSLETTAKNHDPQHDPYGIQWISPQAGPPLWAQYFISNFESQRSRPELQNTDTAILYLDVPAQQAHCLDALQMPLRALPGIYEVAVARSTGSHVRASLKGTAQALDDAQKRLGRALGPSVTIAGSQPEETKKQLPANELQQTALADAGFEKDDARMPASGAATKQTLP